MSAQNISNSTIMFTDIVGYSAMINKDQKHALDLLDTHDAIIEPIIEKNKGTIIKKIGDAIFAEFESPDKCYNTAVTIQNELTKRNLISQANDYINIRIGLHTGKVIRKDNDLFGHDVNLCSRIESIAMKDSIAASAEFIKQVTNDSCLSREIGYVKLKNITHPQKLYKIYINQEDYSLETSRQLYEKCNDNGVSIVDMDSYKIEESFSIGMLYINNIGDAKDESFSYNLSEELISDLGNIDEVRSPSFNQILNYKKSNLGYDDIARKLEVEYILSGNMLKKDNSLKITCELLCVNTGNIIWSDSFEESLSNIKNIRKHIINSILSEFKFEIPQKLLDLYSEKISSNDKAIELYLKGKYCYNFLESSEELNNGKKYIESALELDSDFVEAMSIYGMILYRLGNLDAAESTLLKAKSIASKKKNIQGLADV
jgi:class 3 adenylate cyclase/TolB-like protein